MKDGQLVGVTGQTFGNKLTGQEVPQTYSERQTGEFFGGTFEGKGNTGYGVKFGADGTPIFYAQGASSTDKLVTTLMPMVQIALAATGAGGVLGNALLGTGANQVLASALGGALLGGGTSAIAGQDPVKGALLGGAASYGASALDNYLATGSTADVGLTERQFAIQDAKQLANQGLNATQIRDTLSSGGYGDIVIERALSSLTGTPSSTLPIPGAVNVTDTATPAISTGGLLSSVVAPTTTSTATTAPVTQGGTVNVTGAAQPQLVDQATLNLVANQLASNLGTNANLANVEITANRPATSQEIVNALIATNSKANRVAIMTA
jgi:hypothetical protein